MNRRQFLGYLSGMCASAALGTTAANAKWLPGEKGGDFPPGMLFIDAHAHPDQFFQEILGGTRNDYTSTLDDIRTLGMQASCFAALGDMKSPHAPVTFHQVLDQLNVVKKLEDEREVKIIRRHSRIRRGEHRRHFTPGAILALEGGTPLAGNPDNVDILYKHGVRLITLMHYVDNEIGDVMSLGRDANNYPIPLTLTNGGLTKKGKHIVRRMIALGMVVDVAHAHINTLQGITEIAHANGTPVIDSHTSLTLAPYPTGNRLRTWGEMEMVVKTGGAICTWPSGVYRTFIEWAQELSEIKARFGIEHIALGTDGGGNSPISVQGYRDVSDGKKYKGILDLPMLVDAMAEVGFTRREITDYMGENLYRIFKLCLR
jgi:microsomal dipeptidase-like Zn-dependent dipeptidase